MRFFRSVAGVILAGVFTAPSSVHGETALDTHSFKLVLSGESYTLQRAQDRPIPIPREWLVPARQLAEEKSSSYVSSFDYSDSVTAFTVSGALIGLHLSSFQIQEEGSARAAAGRDVFLLLDPEKAELRPGLLDLGITKGRVRFMGCLSAHHIDFSIEDIDGDLRIDIGMKEEEIQCLPAYDEKEGVDSVVRKEASHPWRWYLFEEDHWEYSAPHEGRIPSAGARELPLIDLVKSPVEFVREMGSPNDKH